MIDDGQRLFIMLCVALVVGIFVWFLTFVIHRRTGLFSVVFSIIVMGAITTASYICFGPNNDDGAEIISVSVVDALTSSTVGVVTADGVPLTDDLGFIHFVEKDSTNRTEYGAIVSSPNRFKRGVEIRVKSCMYYHNPELASQPLHVAVISTTNDAPRKIPNLSPEEIRQLRSLRSKLAAR